MPDNQPIQDDVNAASQFPVPQQGDASMEARPQAQPPQSGVTGQTQAPVPQAPDTSSLPARSNPQQGVTPDVRAPKRSLFDRVLEGAAGGPTYVTDPTTGERREMPMTKKSLTAHILAGAITGIISGAQAPYNPAENPAGTRSGQNMRALSMGANATQAKLADIRNKPQQQLDEQQLRQYQTMKRNIDLSQGMLTLGNSSREAQDKVDATGTTLLQSVDDYDAKLIPEEDRGLTHLEAIKKYPKYSEQNFIPMGHRAMLNPDGTPMMSKDGVTPLREPLFAVVKPTAQVAVTDELKDAYSIQDPSIKGIPVGTVISLSHFLNMNTSHISQVGATDALNDSVKQIAAVTGKPAPDVSKAIMADPVLRRNAAAVGKYLGHGNSVSDAITTMSKDKDVPADVISRLSKVLGLGEVIDGKSVAQMLQDKAAQDKAADKKGGYADSSVVAAFPRNAKINYPTLTQGQIDNVFQSLGNKPTQTDLKDADNKLQAISNSNHQAKLADQGLDEKQQKQLFDYGIVGNTRLTLDTAPDEMMVNQRDGNPIPNKSLTALKASQTEVNRAQFANSTLHLIGSLRKIQAAGNLPNAPLLGGVTNSILSKAGVSSEEAQKAMTEISLLQSAATGAHVGGRFSVPVLEKMNKLLSLNMNDAQFEGTLSAIEDTMQGYKDNGGRFTVAEWRQLPQAERDRLMGQNMESANQGTNTSKPAGAGAGTAPKKDSLGIR